MSDAELMDESTYDAFAEATLQHLADQVEAMVPDIDVERSGPVLTLTLEDDRQFILNKHAVTRQLWLASPISGASHYAWSGTDWTPTRGGHDLTTQLSADLTAATGGTVDLS
jgi:frataxin